MSGLKIGVLISGSGSNLQSVIDATEDNSLKSDVVCVISNKKEAYGLVRAKNHLIPAYYVDPKEEGYDEEVLSLLASHQVDLVVLAGYLKIVPAQMTEQYKDRMINIHPSLLPKYGGKGFYGLNVHKAVLENKEEVSGATVHYVNSGIDTGAIILQGYVAVQAEDTPESLQKRVLEQVEHKLLVEAIGYIEEEACV